MSECTNCNGTGKAACPTCHGQGLTSRVNEDGETVQRLCGFCSGQRQLPCGICRGTGNVAPIVDAAAEAPSPPRPRAAQPDRLAGRWNGAEGTWVEFAPDGKGYRLTAGGMRGVSGRGTATMLGHHVGIDATDVLCGHYTMELTLHGNRLEGIDRKTGFPVPVVFSHA